MAQEVENDAWTEGHLCFTREKKNSDYEGRVDRIRRESGWSQNGESEWNQNEGSEENQNEVKTK